MITRAFRTFHICPDITLKTMYYTRDLCNSDQNLLLSQSIQPLENSLNLALPQQLLGKLLYVTLSLGQCICESSLSLAY